MIYHIFKRSFCDTEFENGYEKALILKFLSCLAYFVLGENEHQVKAG